MQVSFDPTKILTKALGRGGEFSEIFVENLRSNSIVAEENTNVGDDPTPEAEVFSSVETLV